MKTIKIQFITVFIMLLLAIYSLSKALFNTISQILLFFVLACCKVIDNTQTTKELTEMFIEIK